MSQNCLDMSSHDVNTSRGYQVVKSYEILKTINVGEYYIALLLTGAPVI